MPMPPLRFSPILKPKVWGGRSLEGLGKQLPPDTPIGESWELADLPESIADGKSRVEGGPFHDRLLGDLIEHDAKSLLGPVGLSAEGGFPLLLKYLDAEDNLSVQVHPDEAYVADHPEAHLKSEAWFILDAKPGSVIYAGLHPGVDRAQFAASIQDGTVVDHLVAIPAVPGECHYLPSGTCHALGAGVLVAEVQTPSDTTFRVWDWGRSGRELHVEQALSCIDFSGRDVRQPSPTPVEEENRRTTHLVNVDHFQIDRVEAIGNESMALLDTERPIAFMVIQGEGCLNHGPHSITLSRGDTILLPAEREPCAIEMARPMELLQVSLQPSS